MTAERDLIAELLEFMRAGTGAAGNQVTAFLTTLTAAGSPSTRQVSTWVDDDFVVGSITGPTSLKAGHVRRAGKSSFLWVELAPRKPARCVTIEGEAEVVTDPERVRAFLERRAGYHGVAVHQPSLSRHLISLRPTLLRAEGFLERPTAALTIRDFATLEVEYPGG
jgi:pyridoxine/pyridoxamine 5'-phosphate oxidase